jgi:hypothetical protein
VCGCYFYCIAPLEDVLLDPVQLAFDKVLRLLRSCHGVSLERLKAPIETVKFNAELIAQMIDFVGHDSFSNTRAISLAQANPDSAAELGFFWFNDSYLMLDSDALVLFPLIPDAILQFHTYRRQECCDGVNFRWIEVYPCSGAKADGLSDRMDMFGHFPFLRMAATKYATSSQFMGPPTMLAPYRHWMACTRNVTKKMSELERSMPARHP